MNSPMNRGAAIAGKAVFNLLFFCVLAPAAIAQDGDAAAEMARKLQDPLASIKALMTDNTIAFDGGEDDDTSYNFQLQPVVSIPNESRFNVIARAVVPIIGVEPGVVLPATGPNPKPDTDDQWGLGDSFLQLFVSPRTDSSIKYGLGPQVSLKTRTGDRQAGPSWGAGLAAVVVGGSGPWAYGGIVGQHWGEEDDFEVFTVQPFLWYNFESIPGLALGYSNTATYNWNGESDNKWNIPLGLTLGRTLVLSSGNGLDINIGGYKVVERPDNAPKWQLKFGISVLFN